ARTSRGTLTKNALPVLLSVIPTASSTGQHPWRSPFWGPKMVAFPSREIRAPNAPTRSISPPRREATFAGRRRGAVGPAGLMLGPSCLSPVGDLESAAPD